MAYLPAQAGAHVNKMFVVYILKSLNFNWYYVGMTSNLDRRLGQHNLGKVKSTKYYAPFGLAYSKNFHDRISARDHEKFLKIRSNKEKVIADL